MVTAYSPILKLALPVQGELSGTWGDVVNDNITSMVEQAIAGRAVIDTWTTNSHTLTSANGTTSESRCAMLELTDTGTALSGAGTVVCPTASKIYIVKNATGQNITVQTSGGTGILVPDGRTTFLFCDGTNVVEALTHTTSLQLGTSTTVTAVLDEDNMASDSATSLATQQSIKAYVDAQVGANNELSEVLANGNTSGANDIIVDNGQKITVNTIDETTADSGVTIDSVLLKDDSVNATNLEVTNIKANDGTAAGSIANSTGVVTVASAVLTTADINGGTADGVVIGGTTPAAATVTTATANTSLNIAGTVTVTSILDEDNMASDDPAGLATQQSIKAYVDAQVGANNELSEVLANGNTTGGNDIVFSAGDNITNASGDLTIDVAGDIILDADGADFKFRDGGAGFFTISNSSLDAVLKVEQSNEDFIIKGNDGGLEITALTLDMSAEGNATFQSATTARISLQKTSSDKANIFFNTSNGLQFDNSSYNYPIKFDGSSFVFNEQSNDSDFRVESDNYTHMLFVDAGQDRIGIGQTSDPQGTLHVDKDIASGANYGIIQNDGTVNTDTIAGWVIRDGSSITSGIRRRRDGSSSPTEIGTFGDESVQFLQNNVSRIKFNNNDDSVVVNEGGVDADFRVESDTNTHALFVDAGLNVVTVGNSSPENWYSGYQAFQVGLVGSIASNETGSDTDVLQITSNAYLQDVSTLWKFMEDSVGATRLQMQGQDIQFLMSDAAGTANSTVTWDSRMRVDTGATTFNEGGSDYDFRVESQNFNDMLFVDASTDAVGIGAGTTLPTTTATWRHLFIGGNLACTTTMIS
jgi:hypothetical protein